jgi:hypothetical protein
MISLDRIGITKNNSVKLLHKKAIRLQKEGNQEEAITI